jgi:hypothetical protein
MGEEKIPYIVGKSPRTLHASSATARREALDRSSGWVGCYHYMVPDGEQRLILDREYYIDGQISGKSRSNHRSSQRDRPRFSIAPREGGGSGGGGGIKLCREKSTTTDLSLNLRKPSARTTANYTTHLFQPSLAHA